MIDNFFRYLIGLITGIFSLFAPIASLITCAVVFVAIDFVTGVLASRKVARKQGYEWGFESDKAWDTVIKLVFILAGIALSWLIDSKILAHMDLNLANLFTGFVCGVEFWSYLENAAIISNHPIFRYLKRFMRDKMEGVVK